MQHCSMATTLFVLLTIVSACKVVYVLGALPLPTPFVETFWESHSWNIPDGDPDSWRNPWYIRLANIPMHGVNTLGVDVVNIAFADHCIDGCQENYPDEYCSKYPPEGVPARPRTVDDWGNAFNATSTMMTEGIKKIHTMGGKVKLAFGGKEYGNLGHHIDHYSNQTIWEDCTVPPKMAKRIKKNVDDWNLDGVDFHQREFNCVYDRSGSSASLHAQVIRQTRELLGPDKIISYSVEDLYKTEQYGRLDSLSEPFGTVIQAAITYLDYITVFYYNNNEGGHGQDMDMDATMEKLAEYGVPPEKIVWCLTHESRLTLDEAAETAMEVKGRGMAGIGLWSANMENSGWHGEMFDLIAKVIQG